MATSGLDAGSWIAVAGVAIAIAALIVSMVALRLQRRANVDQRTNFDFGAYTSTHQTYSQDLAPAYKERIERLAKKEEADIHKLATLDGLRNHALGKIAKLGFAGWSKLAENSGGVSLESAISSECATRVQDVGILAYHGLVPLDLLLADHAHHFVTDWYLAIPWVTNHRNHKDAIWRITPTAGAPQNPNAVEFSRRHGEWLGLVAALWMMQRWDHPLSIDLVKQMRGRDYVVRRLSQLTEFDDAHPIARRDVKRLLNETA